MFFIDKYTPTADDAIIHKDELRKLQIMSEDESISHLIVHGPEGCGKKTTINYFLEMIYGDKIYKTVETLYTVTGSGNTVHQIPIMQSPFHIVINPNNNNFDRYLIQDVVKEYAKKKVSNMFIKNKSFKVVFINNIDNLSYYAQTSLRRTMELYSGSCRFIMWSRSLSKVIDPLRSRCYCFRLRSPSDEELIEIISRVGAEENIKLTVADYDKIISTSNNNIKTVLWLLQLKYFDIPYDTSYNEIINAITEYILSRDLNNLQYIRLLLYKIMITNVNKTQIIKDIVKQLFNRDDVSFKSKINIAELSAKYEHHLIHGRREIMHLEVFVNAVMYDLATTHNFEEN